MENKIYRPDEIRVAVEKGEIEFSYKGKRFQLQKTKPKLSTSTEEHRRMDNIALDYEVQLIEE